MLMGQKKFSNLWTQPHWKKSSGKTIHPAIPVLCNEGIIDLGIYEGNVNVATFLNFTRAG